MAERVTLRFRGLMLERFLSRALESGVAFETVRRQSGREATLVTGAEGCDRLLKIAERFALDVVVLERRGLDALLRRMLRRATLPLALALCAALALSFLSRLWIVDIRLIDGTFDDAPIHRALEAVGVTPGTRMDAIEAKRLSLNLMAEAPDFAYIGARKQGVRLLIEATRELPAPDLYNPRAARDLVAGRDALLVSLDVMAGTAAAAPGQVVRRGQVLVRGEERDKRETTRGVCALGAALGRAWLTGVAERALVVPTLKDTGRRERASELRMPGFSLPLTRADGFAEQRVEVERLPIGGLVLPLHIVRTSFIEQERHEVSLDPESVKAEITKTALADALSQLPSGVSPVDKWVDYSMIEGGSVRARAVVEIKLNIAVARGALSP
ncbi:sporulation protein YqfD [Bacillota bacterium Meth-B3]